MEKTIHPVLQKFVDSKPRIEDLVSTMGFEETIQQIGWQQFQERIPKMERDIIMFYLLKIIRNMKELRVEAWHVLLDQEPTHRELVYVYQWVDELRQDAHEKIQMLLPID